MASDCASSCSEIEKARKEMERGFALLLGRKKQQKGRLLPKFGEWDMNNPASAAGYTVIFNKARDEKKNSGTAPNLAFQQRHDNHVYKQTETHDQPYPPKKRWLCFGC